MRRIMTPAEAALWEVLRTGTAGARFRRQVPIGDGIADFASTNPPLVIEIDHQEGAGTDRSHYFESAGFPVIRFSEHQVMEKIEDVVDTIESWVAELRLNQRRRR